MKAPPAFLLRNDSPTLNPDLLVWAKRHAVTFCFAVSLLEMPPVLQPGANPSLPKMASLAYVGLPCESVTVSCTDWLGVSAHWMRCCMTVPNLWTADRHSSTFAGRHAPL